MIKVNPPTMDEAALLESRAIMSLFWPAQNKELLEKMAKQGATVLAMDQLPRTLSRGQVFVTSLSPRCPYPARGIKVDLYVSFFSHVIICL